MTGLYQFRYSTNNCMVKDMSLQRVWLVFSVTSKEGLMLTGLGLGALFLLSSLVALS